MLGVPLLAFALLSLTFSNAVIRDLRVDVVDQDQTQTSMTYVQAIEFRARRRPWPDGRPTSTAPCMPSAPARRSPRSIIPRDLERDIAAGKRPQIVIFYNKQFFTPGNVASGALPRRSRPATADLAGVGRRRRAIAPGPLVVEQYVLTNPALNYAQFLLRAILPTVLHVVIAIAGGLCRRLGVRLAQPAANGWRRPAAIR